jgi:hypothetical protein
VYGQHEREPCIADLIKNIPLKLIVLNTDALITNHSIAAAECHTWRLLRAAGDQLAATTGFVHLDCSHHQACLAKKPAILQIGLCSDLVRLCHLYQSNGFCQRFEKRLDEWIDAKFKRRRVFDMPQSAITARESNAMFLALCADGMSDVDIDELLTICSNLWSEAEAVHFCKPGCCENADHFKIRARAILRKVLCNFPDIPLLYRWKMFEPACAYTLRGKCLYDLLMVLIYLALNEDANATTNANSFFPVN